MLEAGSHGTVPLLVFTDGTVLEESLDVMDWSLRGSDPKGWLRAREEPTRRALIETNDCRFKAALDRYKYPERYGLPNGKAAGDEAAAALAGLEAALTQPFLGGDDVDFFDAALFPFVRQFAAVDEARFDAWRLPNLAGWRRRMLEHPAFTQVMKKLPVWTPGEAGPRFRDTLARSTAR